MTRFANILETIGRTPVVRIGKLAPPDVQLFVKIEAFNPLGSVKDRLALGRTRFDPLLDVLRGHSAKRSARCWSRLAVLAAAVFVSRDVTAAHAERPVRVTSPDGRNEVTVELGARVSGAPFRETFRRPARMFRERATC